MRFFAFLCVFFFHVLPSNDVGTHVGIARTIALAESTVKRTGENGVGLFFLLSAFLITELLRREKLKTGTIHLAKFYLRRSLRIWPLYFAAVAIGLVIQPLSPLFQMNARQIWTYLLFLKNWEGIFYGPNWNPIFILWTVSVEEQFYALWPLAQRTLTRQRMLILCAVAMIVIPAVTFWPGGLFARTHGMQNVYLFLYFPIGGALSFLLNGRREPFGRGRQILLGVSGLALWLLSTLVMFPGGVDEGSLAHMAAGELIGTAGTVLIFLVFLRSSTNWPPQPVVYLGKISYGLYVFHIMAVLLAAKIMSLLGFTADGAHSAHYFAATIGLRVPLALGLTIAMAAISYQFLELKFLRLKDRLAFIHSRAN